MLCHARREGEGKSANNNKKARPTHTHTHTLYCCLYFKVHWKSEPDLAGIAAFDRFLVEFRPGNDTKWRRLAEQGVEESVAKTIGKTHSLRTTKLKDAFSVRVMLVDGQRKRAIAVTGEQLVRHKANGNACERVAPEQPKGTANGTAMELSWQRTECVGRIQGWEYSVSGGRGEKGAFAFAWICHRNVAAASTDLASR